MKPNSTITRNEPQDDPYDECVVVGPSPVNNPALAAWPSAGGQSVVVRPTSFGETTVMPLDYIAAHYTVTEPDPVDPVTVEVSPVYSEQPSPEQVFAEEARKNPPKPKADPKPLTKEEIAAKRAAAKAGKPA